MCAGSNDTPPASAAGDIIDGITSDAADFDLAVSYVRSSAEAKKLSTTDKLRLYGLYKQASEGAMPRRSPPSITDFSERAKHDAWSSLGDMSRGQARTAYVASVTALFPQWRQQGELNQPSRTSTPSDSNSASNSGSQAGMQRGYSSRPLEPSLPSADVLAADLAFNCQEGNADAVRRLIASGADVNAAGDGGETLLHLAADAGHDAIIRLLVTGGALVNAVDSEARQSPLHYACSQGRREAAMALIRAGADTSTADVDGALPLELASPELAEELTAIISSISRSAQP